MKLVGDIYLNQNKELIVSSKEYKKILDILKKYGDDKIEQFEKDLEIALKSYPINTNQLNTGDWIISYPFELCSKTCKDKYISNEDKKLILNYLLDIGRNKKIKKVDTNLFLKNSSFTICGISFENPGFTKDFYSRLHEKYITDNFIKKIIKNLIENGNSSTKLVKSCIFMTSCFIKYSIFMWSCWYYTFDVLDYFTEYFRTNFVCEKFKDNMVGDEQSFWELFDKGAKKHELSVDKITNQMREIFKDIDKKLEKHKDIFTKVPDKKTTAALKELFYHYFEKLDKHFIAMIKNRYSKFCEKNKTTMITDFIENTCERIMLGIGGGKNPAIEKDVKILESSGTKLYKKIEEGLEIYADDLHTITSEKTGKSSKNIIVASAVAVITYLTMYGVIKKIDPSNATLNPIKLVILSLKKMSTKLSIGLKSLLFLSALLFSFAVLYLGYETVLMIISKIKQK